MSDICASEICGISTRQFRVGSLIKGKPYKLLVDAAWILPLLYLGSLSYAFCNRFIQDDAFISFVYARNLAEGVGLVWSTGEVVEGYSNFLWVLILSVGEWLQFEIIGYTYWVGLTLYSGSLLIWIYISQSVAGHSRLLRIAFLLALFFNHSWTSFATGGLETPLVTLLFTYLFFLVESGMRRGWSSTRLILVSIATATGVMTRMDFIMLATPFWIAILYYLTNSGSKRPSISDLMALMAPASVIVGSALLARYAYYGSILPNTYWLKVGATPNLFRVVTYFGYFFALTHTYLFFPALVYSLWNRRDRLVILSGGTALLWMSFLLYIGGDFMEFRLFVPILPLLYLVILPPLIELHSHNKVIGGAFLVLILFVAPIVHHYGGFIGQQRGLIPTRSQQAYVMDPYGWKSVGIMLEEVLPADTRIAVTAAGAIPYYSRLFAVDMIGLSDRQIAKEGWLMSTTCDGIHPDHMYGSLPGHLRIAKYEHLESRQIELIIAHPLIISPASAAQMRALTIQATQIKSFWREFMLHTWKDHQSFDFVLLPIQERYLVALYCRKSDKLDELIASQEFPIYTIYRDEWMAPFSPFHTELY